jgi:hypothetical protein
MAAVAVTLAAGTTLGSAAPNAPEDGADTFNVAPGTAVTGTNSGSAVFTFRSSQSLFTITCTLATFTGQTGTTLKVLMAPPVFSNSAGGPCTDSVGALDSFSSSGKWSVAEKDVNPNGAGDEGLPEPNAKGDKMNLTVPMAGLIAVNHSAGCTFTFAPSGQAHLVGKYNDNGKYTILVGIPTVFSGTNCPPPASVTSLSVTYTLGPALFDTS